MRHIPEDELHAYLDQALSRSQCVEIECHLAECRRCQIERDKAAAVRDRTTSLLAETAPIRVHAPPSFEQLLARHHARVSARVVWVTRAKRFGALAAGLLMALGAGWFGRDLLTSPGTGKAIAVLEPISERTLVAVGEVQPVIADTVTGTTVPLTPAPAVVERAAPTRGAPRQLAARTPVTDPALEAQVTTISGDEETPVLPGIWQQIDWQQATSETGGNLARIDGLPVLDIQVQRSTNGERPLVVISQQHPSGRILRTIEGPIERVEDLVDRQARSSGTIRASVPAMTQPDYIGEGTSSTRRGLRILTVVGSLPSDSLNAMAKAIEIRP